MQLLIKMQFGSHVYGTNTPESDRDYKGIYIPSAEDILLQKVRATVSQNTKKDTTTKNTANDVDVELFSLQQYMKLLCEGQTAALDMMFTPERFYEGDVSPLWNELRANKDLYLHSGITAFVGYARTQAAKYGLKGGRVAAVREALEFFRALPPHSKVGDHVEQMKALWGDVQKPDTSLISLIEIENLKIGTNEKFLEVCNRKIPFSASAKYGAEILQKTFEAYGQRALQAEKNENVDWKALMHAVRVNGQAKELLATGHITFPRPDCELLLQIRTGKLSYKQVAEVIESGLDELESTKSSSHLRVQPDLEAANQFIINAYRNQVNDD